MAKTKRIKTVTAGRLVFGVCYTQAMSNDTKQQRAAKNKCSSAARAKLNFRFAYQKLRLLLAANFSRRDIWATLTFDDEHLPLNRKAAKKYMSDFIDRLRSQRKGQGEILKYVYCCHELTQEDRRLHFHVVLNSTTKGKDFEMLRALWGGGYVEVSTLSRNELYSDDFLELAQYMLHERNPDAPYVVPGDKGFVPSRNLARPVEASYMVEDNVTITAPPGATIIDSDSQRVNTFGTYDYIVYLLPDRGSALRQNE